MRNNSLVKNCGPYDNFGYTNRKNDPNGWNIGGDWFNQYILPKHPEYPLRDAAGAYVSNRYLPDETAMDNGNQNFINDFMALVQNPSKYISRITGDYKADGFNYLFLDNGIVDIAQFHDRTAINPRTGKPFTAAEKDQAALNSLTWVDQIAKPLGFKTILNIWSDIGDPNQYFSRAIYGQLMERVDDAYFEASACNNPPGTDEATWIGRLKIAADIASKHRATPVWSADCGDYWFNTASILLACQPGKCKLWAWNPPVAENITKNKMVDMGTPLGPVSFGAFTNNVQSCSYRAWSNGTAVGNGSTTRTCNFTLGMRAKDAETGTIYNAGSVITIQPRKGKVFIKVTN